MEMGVGPEPLDPTDDGRARQAALAQEHDDGLVERLAVAMVGLADVDADEERRPFDAHQIARPMMSPAATATRPRSIEPPRLAMAMPYEPLSIRPHDLSM